MKREKGGRKPLAEASQALRHLQRIWAEQKKLQGARVSQGQMSQETGWSQQTISGLLTGSGSPLTFDAICMFAAFLRVHPREIDPGVGRLVDTLSSYVTTPAKDPHPAPGIYRRHDGKLFEIIGTSRHTDSGALDVVSRGLFGRYLLSHLPLAAFQESVEGKPRFAKLIEFQAETTSSVLASAS